MFGGGSMEDNMKFGLLTIVTIVAIVALVMMYIYIAPKAKLSTTTKPVIGKTSKNLGGMVTAYGTPEYYCWHIVVDYCNSRCPYGFNTADVLDATYESPSRVKCTIFCNCNVEAS